MSESNLKAGAPSLLLPGEADITTEEGFNQWVERIMKRQKLSHAAAVAASQAILQKRLQANANLQNQAQFN